LAAYTWTGSQAWSGTELQVHELAKESNISAFPSQPNLSALASSTSAILEEEMPPFFQIQ